VLEEFLGTKELLVIVYIKMVQVFKKAVSHGIKVKALLKEKMLIIGEVIVLDTGEYTHGYNNITVGQINVKKKIVLGNLQSLNGLN